LKPITKGGREMTNKQKAGMLSGIVSIILHGIFSIMLLRFIKAPSVIWLMFWFSLIFSGISTALIKYIFEITND